MRRSICETCTAFSPSGQKNENGSLGGECRANPPIVVLHWYTPQGGGWQGGYPPTNSQSWCREHEARLGAVPATGSEE